MLNNFFELNNSYTKLSSPEIFKDYLNKNDCLFNLAFMPTTFDTYTIENKKFEDFSFSKTTLEKINFKSCLFTNCLFIGTKFNNCRIHNCDFINCNFFRAEFSNTYAKPKQFKNSIINKEFANIAVSLFNQLKKQYKEESQNEYKRDAEYYFNKWNRILIINEYKKEKTKRYKYFIWQVFSYLHYFLFGFGYRLRNLILTTSVALISLSALNYYYSSSIFIDHLSNMSLIKTVYFTITTMVTLGASGFSEFTEFGYYFVLIDVMVGMFLLSFTVNSILKRIAG